MALASMPRQPFGEIASSRLQSLQSAKNRQNAITEMLADTKGGKSKCDGSKFVLNPPTKRARSPVCDEEHENAENIDPVQSPSTKRAKGLDSLPKDSTFSFSSKLEDKMIPRFPAIDQTPKTLFKDPVAPSSAPVGRFPKPKRVDALSRKRSSLSPYKRISPLSRGLKRQSSALPFSLDAALSGTVSNKSHTSGKSKAPNLEETMPKGWFFDIHEDTPDEEAAIMMEHSTGTLDISSDDEAGPSRKKDERGKENIPPSDFEVSTTPAGREEEALTRKTRRSAHVDAMVDDGEERSPLGDLPAEDFYAKGLDGSSVEVVSASEHYEKETHEPEKPEEGSSSNTGAVTETTSPVDPGNGPDDRTLAKNEDTQSAFVIAEDPVAPNV